MNKYRGNDPGKSNKDESNAAADDDKTKPHAVPNKTLTTMWRYLVGDQAFNAKTGNSKANKNAPESVIGTRARYLLLGLGFICNSI